MSEETEKTPAEMEADLRKAAIEANERRNNERLERLNSIADQADERKVEQDEMRDIADEEWDDRAARARRKAREVDLEEPADKVVAEAEGADRAADEARDAGATDVKEVNGETYYQLIVNGQEKWLTLQQIRDTASKVAAADQYLHDAKQAARTAVTQAPSSPDEQASPDKGRVRELFSRALMGEEQAVDELAATLTRGLSGNVTPDVLRAVDERVDGRLTFRDAFSKFERDYKDEWNDPDWRDFMQSEDAKLAESNPRMPFDERLRMVGEKARRMRGGRSPVVSAQKLAEKDARKVKVRIPPAASGRRVESESEDEDEDVGSVIQDMAKSRGQSRPVVHKR